MLYKDDDSTREFNIELPSEIEKEEYRTPFRRDYARLIHSPVFRRLQGKTQLFPGIESDFFRNRLSHSLEVAQIAKSIAIRINNKYEYFQKNPIDLDLVETAGLAHDLGHPPFGHNGELALDCCMKGYGGFEGNAQTLRILSRLEKREILDPRHICGITEQGEDTRVGLNLTHRTLAAILKYDCEIPVVRKEDDNLQKGYYESDKELVERIKSSVLDIDSYNGEFKTIECQIMDIADDIAYSTYDLEDSLKGGFITPLDILTPEKNLLERISKKVTKNINKNFTAKDVLRILIDIWMEQKIFDFETFGIDKQEFDIENSYDIANLVTKSYQAARDLGRFGQLRTQFTSHLVGEFVRGIEVVVNEEHPSLTKVSLAELVLKKVEVLKHFNYEAIIMSPMLKVVEYRGFDIVKTIFEKLSTDDNNRDGSLLLPDDCRRLFSMVRDEAQKKRILCDFVAGMTDRYAIEFYGRLVSENAYTIYKPL